MRIMIIGYSGSGKSTLARILAEFYHIPILHLDSLYFLPHWQERPRQEMVVELDNFMKLNPSWVIDGNYTGVCYQERLDQADQIIFMNFNRWSALFRAFRRYLKYKGKTRPDMGPDCQEKFDFEFIKWILKDGRGLKQTRNYQQILEDYPDKCLVIDNQKELDIFVSTLI